MPTMTMQKRVALVTGGTRGIGRAVAERLAVQGMTVVVNGTGLAAAEAAAREIAAGGAEVAGLAADVADEDAVNAMVAEIDRRYGRLDILVANAGISPRLDGRRPNLEETPTELWRHTMDVNLTGTFFVCRAAAPVMKRHGWGRIVIMGSQGGRMYSGFSSVYYAASKAGVMGFARTIAGELGPSGITVNSVSPSRVTTDMARSFRSAASADAVGSVEQVYLQRTPVGRVGEPADVAGAVAYLVSEEAGFVTGAILDVTGGFYMP